MNEKQVVLLGVGAVGGALLCRKPENTEHIFVMVSGERKERMKRDGIFFNDRQYFPQIWQQTTAPDYLLIAVKNPQLEEAIIQIKEMIGAQTVLVPLMNGISAAEILRERFPQNPVVTAAVYVDAQKRGSRITCTGSYVVEIGDAEPFVLEETAALLESFGISGRICEDMRRKQWKKWMVNIGSNQVSAILRATYGEISRTPEAKALILAAMEEVVAVAQAAGVRLYQEDAVHTVERIPTWGEYGKSSMLQDVEAERKTEVEVFSGTLMEIAARYGVQTPVNQTLYWLLRATEMLYLQKQHCNQYADK